jgi:uncharacterized protein involved in exopolysaccharide biosynthesis
MSLVDDYKYNKKEDTIEIRTSDIIDFFKKNYQFVLFSGLVGLIIGAVYAFSKPNIYTTQISVMPEIQSKGSSNLGGLGSLAGLAGINIDNVGGQDVIRPDLYPNILQSVPFALYLSKQLIYSKNLNKKLLLHEYISETNGWKLEDHFQNSELDDKAYFKLPNQKSLIQLTKREDNIIKNIQSSVMSVFEKKSGILTISTTEYEPNIAAIVAQYSLNYLTNYIIDYRTEKARRQVNFLRKQVTEAQRRYQFTEYAISKYRDNNRATYLNTAKIEEQRLQADYLLAQSVYNELSKQLEQAKIKVQEETPVFKVLEPATVPLQKSGPKRVIIIIIFMVATMIAGGLFQLIKIFLQRNP